jgi:low affinity Fe/Cu permease
MYPQPYYAPQMPQYYGAPIDALRPARRASLLMFIVGPVMLLLATCLFSMPAMMNAMPGPQVDQLRARFAAQSPLSLETVCRVFSVVCAVPGLALIVLAFFVRGGGKIPAVLSCVVVGLIAVVLAINLIGSLAQASDPNVLPGVCFIVVALAVIVLQFVWLIQATIASGRVQLAQQQFAAQYWQYQQTMQAYANAGYGYQTPQQSSPATPPPPGATPADQPPGQT